MYKIKLSSILAFTLICLVSAKFLAQKPDFITPCKQADPNYKQCVVKNFQAFFGEFKDGSINIPFAVSRGFKPKIIFSTSEIGVPGLKSVGPIDPFRIKHISLAEDASRIVSINIDFTNVELHGLRNTIINDADFELTKLANKMTMTVPELIMTSDYVMKGRILALSLNGNGKAQTKLENLKLNVIYKMKLREENGHKFTDLDKLRVEVADLGRLQSNWENLFNGQRDLEESANALFNDNWKELFEALKPSFTLTVQKVLEDRFRKLFAYIPADYYFEDL